MAPPPDTLLVAARRTRIVHASQGVKGRFSGWLEEAGPGGSLLEVSFDSDIRPANGDSVRTIACGSQHSYRARPVFLAALKRYLLALLLQEKFGWL